MTLYCANARTIDKCRDRAQRIQRKVFAGQGSRGERKHFQLIRQAHFLQRPQGPEGTRAHAVIQGSHRSISFLRRLDDSTRFVRQEMLAKGGAQRQEPQVATQAGTDHIFVMGQLAAN